MAFLDTRSYKGTPITRRTTDGYVNATAMCKANYKRWSDYRESDRAEKYLQALESVTGISVNGLIDTKIGGSNGGGTWIHPQVAVDLARWISAPFAVWMDGWFLEAASPASPKTVTELPSGPEKILALGEATFAFLEKCGGVDDRTQLLLKDAVLNNFLKASGGSVALPEAQKSETADEYSTLAEYLIELNCPPHKATPLATEIGRKVKDTYREIHKREPKSQKVWVNGGNRPVALYEKSWLDAGKDSLLDAITKFLA